MTMISRQAAEALFQEQVISTVLQDTPKSSVFMSLARRLPNMTGQQGQGAGARHAADGLLGQR